MVVGLGGGQEGRAHKGDIWRVPIVTSHAARVASCHGACVHLPLSSTSCRRRSPYRKMVTKHLSFASTQTLRVASWPLSALVIICNLCSEPSIQKLMIAAQQYIYLPAYVEH